MQATRARRYLSRLLPAASLAAVVAMLCHVVGVAVASRSVGLESLYIAVLTYLLTLVVALPVGLVLLLLVAALRLGLLSSMLLFLVVVQAAAALLVSILFESSLADLPLQYLLVSLPATFTAWYFSVCQADKH